MKPNEALEAAISALTTMRAISPNNYEYFGQIIEGLHKLREKQPETVTLNELVERQRQENRAIFNETMEREAQQQPRPERKKRR